MKPTSPQNSAWKRAAAYIRESSEEQDKGFSPENQRKRIEEYAHANSLRIVASYKDLVSGRDAKKRDDFQRMMDDAMQHKFDVILIFHTSRFARNVSDARQYKDLLRKKLNIDVISITQNFGDWSDPSAFLNEGINELFDEHQSRQISFWVRSNLMEKRMQGKKIANPPFGYYKKEVGYDPERQRKIYESKWHVEPTEAKWVKKIFTWYATGTESFSDIAHRLNEAKVRTKYGNPFTYSSIKDIIKNRAYIGCTTSPRRSLPEIPNTHEAIISKELFDKVQDARTTRRHGNGRPVAQHRFYLLQGIVYCEACRKREKAHASRYQNTFSPVMYCQSKVNDKGEEDKRYICKFRKEDRTCKQPLVTCDIIDQQVIQFMGSFSLPKDVIEMTISKLRSKLDTVREHPDTKDGGNTELEKKLRRLDAQKNRLNVQFEKYGEIPEDEYAERLRAIKQQMAVIESQLGISTIITPKHTTLTTEDKISAVQKFLTDFPAFFAKLPEDEKRAWVQMCIKRVWVKNKKVVAIEPHDEFTPLFKAFKEWSESWKDSDRAPLATPNRKNALLLERSGAFLFYMAQRDLKPRHEASALREAEM